MTLMINLPPEVETRLKTEALRQGVEPADYARRLIENALPGEVPDRATLDLFAQWASRDATNDPEELARRNKEFEEFKQAINRTREDAGARKIYP